MPTKAAAAKTHAPMEEIIISVPLDGSSASSSDGMARMLESKVRMRDFMKAIIQGDLRRR